MPRLRGRVEQRQTLLVHDRTNELGNDLGVGLTLERVPLGFQLVLQDVKVLDDPVVDEGHLAARVDVRMGVDVVGRAVSGPPGVSDADRALLPGPGQRFFEIAELPGPAHAAMVPASGRAKAIPAESYPRYSS